MHDTPARPAEEASMATTSQEKRNSGISMVGDVPWGTHFCQFYRTKQDLLDILVPYFKAGLENNEYCMWVTSEPLSVEEAKGAMRENVPGFADSLEKGQIEIIPYDRWYTEGGSFEEARVLNGWVSRLEGARKKGFDGLRLTGNTFWLEKEDWNAFTDYEGAVNSVIGNYKMLAVCTYSLEKCGVVEILDVVKNHEFALAMNQGKWQVVNLPASCRAA
ncbi:MAG: MEDS domain-containing protein [Deltaproteobacteria bacterium]|nr:MEDS domain-containing protein [Deltaproteobacteria bacterium]